MIRESKIARRCRQPDDISEKLHGGDAHDDSQAVVVLGGDDGGDICERIGGRWSAEKKPYPTFGKIERKDPRFDQLIPHGRQARKAGRGFRLGRRARLGQEEQVPATFRTFRPTA